MSAFFSHKGKSYLKNIMKFGKTVSNIVKKEFGSKPVYNKKHLKNKVKACNGKINTNFHNIKIPKEDFQCICLLVLLMVSIYRKYKDYYPELFLEKYKHV